jgi:pimeloyl-ACP methyl ester carboxylesterase
MTPATDQFVVSADGTSIALSTTGTGQPVVIVAGPFDTRTFGRVPALAAALQDRFQVTVYDRRGRGASGDTRPYSVEREVEDLAAVLQAVSGGAASGDGPSDGGTGDGGASDGGANGSGTSTHAVASVIGLSSGGALALLGLIGGLPIDRAVVYETPYRTDAATMAQDDAALATLDALVAAGRPRAVLRHYFLRMLREPRALASGMRFRGPSRRGLLAGAPTLPHDVRVMQAFSGAADALGAIDRPVLVVSGGASPDWVKLSVLATVQAVPGSEHTVLNGQDRTVDGRVLGPVAAAFLQR